MGILKDIIASKRQEVAELHRKPRPPLPERRSPEVSLKRSSGSPLSLIAELKFRSPSAGDLSRALDAGERARAYHEAGAAMMSVLCDAPFFGGGYADLLRARHAAPIPLLCKEFVVDEIQLHYAAAHSADWVLLIVRCLSATELRSLITQSAHLGLTPLVEVYEPDEVAVALHAGATVIGVNARDLNTLHMNAERAARILDIIPADVTALHLSGVKTPADVKQLAQSRADGALIGEVLMRQENPRELLSAMLKETFHQPG
jgi:indole-3-glycerol phosphate synthase